jgi:hypothetical protein
MTNLGTYCGGMAQPLQITPLDLIKHVFHKIRKLEGYSARCGGNMRNHTHIKIMFSNIVLFE